MLLRKPSDRIRQHAFGPSAELRKDALTFLPPETKLRALRDTIIIEPDEVAFSKTLLTPTDCKPLSGTVLAVGPGCYPNRYDHVEKSKRTKVFAGKRFRPTVVKVGDKVEIGGAAHGGFAALAEFWWGEKYCLVFREEDVCFIRNPEALAEGAVA